MSLETRSFSMDCAQTMIDNKPGSLSEFAGSGLIGVLIPDIKIDEALRSHLLRSIDLSSGGRGRPTVHHKQHPCGLGLICKTVPTYKLYDEALFTEECKHPNIVPLLGVIKLDARTTTLVYPYRGPSLYDITKYESRREMHEAVKNDVIHPSNQMNSILDYLKFRNIVHMDIKPNNITVVLNEGRPHLTLVDFGSAQKICDTRKYCDLGWTPLFLSDRQRGVCKQMKSARVDDTVKSYIDAINNEDDTFSMNMTLLFMFIELKEFKNLVKGFHKLETRPKSYFDGAIRELLNYVDNESDRKRLFNDMREGLVYRELVGIPAGGVTSFITADDTAGTLVDERRVRDDMQKVVKVPGDLIADQAVQGVPDMIGTPAGDQLRVAEVTAAKVCKTKTKQRVHDEIRNVVKVPGGFMAGQALKGQKDVACAPEKKSFVDATIERWFQVCKQKFIGYGNIQMATVMKKEEKTVKLTSHSSQKNAAPEGLPVDEGPKGSAIASLDTVLLIGESDNVEKNEEIVKIKPQGNLPHFDLLENISS